MQVFLNGEVVEHPPAFRDVGNVAPHPFPSWQVADVLAVEIDVTTAGRNYTQNGFERCCLAHAIAPHQAHGLPLLKPEGQIVEDVASAIKGVQVFYFQKAVGHAASSSSSFPR